MTFTTESVGWATTDSEYSLLKVKGKDYWGVYLFDEAKTAESRRVFRSARRRLARTRQRINLLQELFSEEISKVDFSFFSRINNSKFETADKEVEGKDSLFHDELFSDKDYYKKYKTIYHLRSALTNLSEAVQIKDIRLLYLAIHHIIKNRGHFLFEGQEIQAGDKNRVLDSFYKINQIQSEYGRATIDVNVIPDLIEILLDKKCGKNDKEKSLKKALQINAKDKQFLSVIKSIIGKKVTVADFLIDEQSSEIKDFCFDDANFDLEKFRNEFSEVNFSLIYELKVVYDWSVLAQILGGYTYISQAMIAGYESHAEDLKYLKEYVKSNFGEEKYKEVFHKNSHNNYAAYIGLHRKKRFKHVSKEDFYKYLKSFVKDENILKKIEEGTFLTKQRSNVNGVIPYQVHKSELEAILKNAEINFPFLKEVKDGLSVSEKIIKLLTFRIPYYVGPLNDAHSKDGRGFAWVKKFSGKENEKITPWNFDEVVDKSACEDEFIRRMTNKCTYLLGEDVLPKHSLLYSEFAFLNELNNLRFKGEKLDDAARKIVIDYAKNHGKITLKRLIKVLIENCLIEPNDDKVENFSGLDGDFKNTLSSHKFFSNIFGSQLDYDMCEQIILWFTVMEDKARVIERVKRIYNLPESVLKQLKGYNCSGWGRLSKKFLTEINHVDEFGEIFSIIQMMRQSSCNLMELLSSKYNYLHFIDEHNKSFSNEDKITYKTIEDLYCSPAVKRAIWRTVCLAREIEKVQGCAPERIFVEMARGASEEQKGKRTKSRKEQLKALYASIKDEERDWVKEIDSVPDNKFSSDKLFLYYMQMGRSMYSGKPINLEDVFNTNICDIDHIYPQSRIKDDSLHNRVLCFKSENAVKTDSYPIAEGVRSNMHSFWTMLLKEEMISEEKFKRLTRHTPLTIEELTDFINRQLVETRQSTKLVCSLLKQLYPKSQIVYSKAGNVNNFKNEMGIVKVRELNDLHHAKDAYLNIVVGNAYYAKFTKNAVNFFKENSVNHYHLKYLFNSEIKGAWHPNLKDKIKQAVLKNTCKVVRFTSEGEGKLYDATIKTKGANDSLIPLKMKNPLNDTKKYGGYDSATTAYFSLIRSVDKKGNPQLSLEAIPVYIDLLGSDSVNSYLKDKLKLLNAEVCVKKIKINTLLKINGAYYWLRGKSGDSILICNANQLVLDYKSVVYLKKITSFLEKQKKANKPLEIDEEHDKISKEENLNLYRALVYKLSSDPYINMPSIMKQTELLKEGEDVFANLECRLQLEIIMAVLHFMQCNKTSSDLSLLNGSKNAGILTRNKKILRNEEVVMITQSPTGYYQTKTDLVSFYSK